MPAYVCVARRAARLSVYTVVLTSQSYMRDSRITPWTSGEQQGGHKLHLEL